MSSSSSTNFTRSHYNVYPIQESLDERSAQSTDYSQPTRHSYSYPANSSSMTTNHMPAVQNQRPSKTSPNVQGELAKLQEYDPKAAHVYKAFGSLLKASSGQDKNTPTQYDLIPLPQLIAHKEAMEKEGNILANKVLANKQDDNDDNALKISLDIFTAVFELEAAIKRKTGQNIQAQKKA